jgi:hypothetical protein
VSLNKQEQKGAKVKKVLSNFIGVSVGAVVVVTTFISNVTAEFLQIDVFQDSIIYTVEVIEEVEGDVQEGDEVISFPLRLLVSSQFGDEILPLEYGITTGSLNNLKQNSNYTLKVQIEKDVGWVTVTSETVSLETNLAASVYDFTNTSNMLSNTFDAVFNIFYQKAGAVTDDDWAIVTYGDIEERVQLIEGEQTITLEQLPHINEDILIEIYTSIDGIEELVSSKKYQPSDRLYASFELLSEDPLNIRLNHDLDFNSFDNIIYKALVYSNGELIDEQVMTDDDTIITFGDYNQTYQVDVIVTYIRNDEQLLQILKSYEVTTEPLPYHVLTYKTTDEKTEFVLTVLDDNNAYNNPKVIIDNTVYSLDYLDKIDGFKTYTLTLDITSFNSITCTIETNNELPYTLILERISD